MHDVGLFALTLAGLVCFEQYIPKYYLGSSESITTDVRPIQTIRL